MVFQSAVRTHSGGGELARGFECWCKSNCKKAQSLMTDRRYNCQRRGAAKYAVSLSLYLLFFLLLLTVLRRRSKRKSRCGRVN
ncbi:hypothetical protein CEXT_538451 [Caerostris extrusa]|uniref:Uncharacterized protein n=1 Tax=Caerostris extrusa TaxID=172846 RepID=A0AAV4MDL4_CAEEX|nr:hypothetical protein CEXT_538451 [Caerostris extrusa]